MYFRLHLLKQQTEFCAFFFSFNAFTVQSIDGIVYRNSLITFLFNPIRLEIQSNNLYRFKELEFRVAKMKMVCDEVKWNEKEKKTKIM